MGHNQIIKPEYELEPIYNEQTKLCLRNKNRLKVTVGGLESTPVIDAAVPDGKEWLVHLHIEIHEKPETKP